MQQAAPRVNLVVRAGIGPEISLAAALKFLCEQEGAVITLLGDEQLLGSVEELDPKLADRLFIQNVKLGAPSIPGGFKPQ